MGTKPATPAFLEKLFARVEDHINGDGVAPPRPRLTLRVGFAGNRRLDIDDAALQARLETVFTALRESLQTVHTERSDERLSGFYADTPPQLRLTTGLCEGADAITAETFHALGTRDPAVAHLQSAVLAYPLDDYRRSRDEDFHATFDELVSRCDWVLELDGRYDTRDRTSELARLQRSRAYQAQSAFTLRHSDILVCALDLGKAGKRGGTAETLRDAHALGIPAIVIDTDPDAFARTPDSYYLIGGDDYLPDVLSARPLDSAALGEHAGQWVKLICAGNHDSPITPDNPRAHQALQLLQRYFNEPGHPPTKKGPVGWWKHARRRAWEAFERVFKTAGDSANKRKDGSTAAMPKHSTASAADGLSLHRARASDLSGFYIGRYRGAFLLNYGAAIAATALATCALLLLAIVKTDIYTVLLVFAGMEGIAVGFILRNTHRANDERWNHNGIDMRFLAERLRAMGYLPHAYSLRPPPTGATWLESRSTRQSAVDWLFQALCREISLADTAPPVDAGPVRIKADPLATLDTVRAGWIEGQIHYQANTHQRNEAMHRTLEHSARLLGKFVLAVVIIDIVLITLKIAFEPSFGKWVTPSLIALTAMLPAVIAGMSGLLSQSESQSLAERAAFMHQLLSQHHTAEVTALTETIEAAAGHPDTDPGSWAHPSLRYVEKLASDFSQEVSEWSVLYTNDVHEP